MLFLTCTVCFNSYNMVLITLSASVDEPGNRFVAFNCRCKPCARQASKGERVVVCENAQTHQNPAGTSTPVIKSSGASYSDQAELAYECLTTRPDTVPSDYENIHVHEETM